MLAQLAGQTTDILGLRTMIASQIRLKLALGQVEWMYTSDMPEGELNGGQVGIVITGHIACPYLPSLGTN